MVSCIQLAFVAEQASLSFLCLLVSVSVSVLFSPSVCLDDIWLGLGS